MLFNKSESKKCDVCPPLLQDSFHLKKGRYLDAWCFLTLRWSDSCESRSWVGGSPDAEHRPRSNDLRTLPQPLRSHQPKTNFTCVSLSAFNNPPEWHPRPFQLSITAPHATSGRILLKSSDAPLKFCLFFFLCVWLICVKKKRTWARSLQSWHQGRFLKRGGKREIWSDHRGPLVCCVSESETTPLIDEDLTHTSWQAEEKKNKKINKKLSYSRYSSR